MKRLLAFGTTMIALPLALSLPAGTAHAGYYDGKDVTVLIGAGAGGGLTRSGRAVMTAIGRFLGKDTNMVIRNLPGAGGAKALNFFAEKARPDGLNPLVWAAPPDRQAAQHAGHAVRAGRIRNDRCAGYELCYDRLHNDRSEKACRHT